MAVTEFALLPLKSRGELPAELASLLEECQKIQDQWRLAQDPSLPADRNARGTAMYHQLEDPSVLLITTQWPSPEGHATWISSPENTAAMKQLAPFLDLEGDKHVGLFHLDAEVLTDFDRATQKSALEAPIMSVGRFTVKDGQRDEFQKAFEGARWVGEEVSKPYPLRGGWRIEKKADKDEFVTFAGWESVEHHMSALKHESWGEWDAVQGHLERTDIRHYKRVV